MIKFIISVWISGILYTGNVTENKYLVGLYEPVFDTRTSCETHMINNQDEWFGKLSKYSVEINTTWIGLIMNEDPQCVPYNIETKEVYDAGHTL